MKKEEVTIFWFRQDLRIQDNPGLLKAIESNLPVLPIFIVPSDIGGATKWWLHHSLMKLNEKLGGKLSFYGGPSINVFKNLLQRYNVRHVFWNRCYEPKRIQEDSELKKDLKAQGIRCESFNASLLWEPHTILKNDGTPYKVFTPFYRKGCLTSAPPRRPLLGEKISKDHFIQDTESLPLNAFGLIPEIPWYKTMETVFQIGEDAALSKMKDFFQTGLFGYKEKRNYPSLPNVSRLSPHLHFGEISPHTLWENLLHIERESAVPFADLDHFKSELGWREFSHALLYHFPTLPHANFQEKFNRFPWQQNEEFLKAWQQGKTGYPIVDAAMRELWQTGYMHNRCRMIVGSFLVKNLLLDWRLGAAWFWDCLVDADLANNSASWQWVAGSGADAAPYFRIFNPITQAEKFDPDGVYIRHYLPELNTLPKPYLYAPHKAPQEILQKANICLGLTYPNPIVSLDQSREQALAAFSSL